jgi:hypothetical protein
MLYNAHVHVVPYENIIVVEQNIAAYDGVIEIGKAVINSNTRTITISDKFRRIEIRETTPLASDKSRKLYRELWNNVMKILEGFGNKDKLTNEFTDLLSKFLESTARDIKYARTAESVRGQTDRFGFDKRNRETAKSYRRS